MPDSPGIPPRTVTVPGVELVQAGTWAASTGMLTVRPDHLESMVAASKDPAVDRAPVKIGHLDPRFADGEPAYGWATNLRVEQRDELDANEKPTGRKVPTLVGDLTDVPIGLAAIMPKAYARRSIEIGWGYRTPAGARYPAALTALALLGAAAPAVKGLADVVSLYSQHHSGHVLASSTLAFGRAGLPDEARQLLTAAAAAFGYGTDVAGAWVDDLETRIRATPAPLGQDGGAQPSPPGRPTTVDEARIRQLLGITAEADIEAAVAQLVAQPPAAPAPAGTPAATAAAGQPPAPAPAAPPAGVTVPAAAPVPANTPAGTPAPAVPAAPAAVGSAGTPAPAPPAPAAPGTPAATPAPVGLPDGVTVPAGMTLVSEQILAELRQGAQAGIAANQALQEQAIDRELVAALSAGKIAPAERDQWRANMLANTAGTRALLAAMAPRFTTVGVGSAAPLDAAIDDAQWDAFESSVFGFETPAAPATPAAQGA